VQPRMARPIGCQIESIATQGVGGVISGNDYIVCSQEDALEHVCGQGDASEHGRSEGTTRGSGSNSEGVMGGDHEGTLGVTTSDSEATATWGMLLRASERWRGTSRVISDAIGLVDNEATKRLGGVISEDDHIVREITRGDSIGRYEVYEVSPQLRGELRVATLRLTTGRDPPR
jgi:hypothetical protein